MAVRVSHTNNSSGHDGTYVYRATSPMDPQNLPAPIADAPPVALGAMFEYIDNAELSGDQYYRTQDHEGGQVSAVSSEVSITIPLSPPGVGEYWTGEGGYYAGIITYADSSQYHLIVADAASQQILAVKTENSATAGTQETYDGASNTAAMEAAGLSLHPAADACVSYSADDKSDFYLGAREEWVFLHGQLSTGNAPTANFQAGGGQAFDAEYYWSSTENASSTSQSTAVRMSDAFISTVFKTNTRRIRPVRRVPV